MSRLGKKPIKIPDGVQVEHIDGDLKIKGPKGELSRFFKNTKVNIEVNQENKEIQTSLLATDKEAKTLWGTYSAHIKNMLEGVTNNFTKKLILEGIGYKSDVAGDKLNLSLGFSHPVIVEIPKGLTVTTDKAGITIVGVDKEIVGAFAAKVRNMKKPEPYKGKGFRYSDEVIRRKQGKKGA